jgi:HSP20 family protein
MRKDFNNFVREFLSDDFLTNFHYDPFFNLPKLKNNNVNVNNKEYSHNLPATNVFEDEWSYKFELSTPGFTKKDLTIELDNNVVTVSGERKLECKKGEGEYITKEYHSTKFHRSFTLPENVVADEIHAKSLNGITTLFLPKVTPTKSKNFTKTITVE